MTREASAATATWPGLAKGAVAARVDLGLSVIVPALVNGAAAMIASCATVEEGASAIMPPAGTSPAREPVEPVNWNGAAGASGARRRVLLKRETGLPVMAPPLYWNVPPVTVRDP